MLRRRVAYLLSMIMVFTTLPVDASRVYAQTDTSWASELGESETIIADTDLPEKESDLPVVNEEATHDLRIYIDGDKFSYSAGLLSENEIITVKISDVLVKRITYNEYMATSSNSISIRELVTQNLSSFTGRQVLDTISVSIDDGESVNSNIDSLYRLDVETVSGGKVYLDGNSDVLSTYDYAEGTHAKKHVIYAIPDSSHVFMGWDDGNTNVSRVVYASPDVSAYTPQFRLSDEVTPVLVATVSNGTSTHKYSSDKVNKIIINIGDTVQFSAKKPSGADSVSLVCDYGIEYFSRTSNSYRAIKETGDDYATFYARAKYGDAVIDSDWMNIYIAGITSTRVNLTDFRDYITEGYTIEFKAKALNESGNMQLVISEGTDYVDSISSENNNEDNTKTFKIKFKKDKPKKGNNFANTKFKILVNDICATIDSDTDTEKSLRVYSNPESRYNSETRTLSYSVPSKVNTGTTSGRDADLFYTQDIVSEVTGIRLNVLSDNKILGTTTIASNKGQNGTIAAANMETMVTNLANTGAFSKTCDVTFRAYPCDKTANCNKNVYSDSNVKVYEVLVKIQSDTGALIKTYSYYGLLGQTIDVSSLGKFKSLTNGVADVASEGKITVSGSEFKNVYEGIFENSSTDKIKKITIDKSSIELCQGETAAVNVSISPDTAAPSSVVWTSSDEEIATIANNPLTVSGNNMIAVITAGSKEGTATLTASAGNVKAALKVKVVMPVKFDRHIMTLVSRVGSTGKIIPTVAGRNYEVDALVWSSSDENVATVDKGIVTAATNLTESATAVITAETPDRKFSDICIVTVNTMPVSMMPVASRPSGELTKGTKILLTAATQGADIYYTTDNTSPSLGSDGKPAGSTMLYDDAITIVADTVIRAISRRDGYKNSNVSSFSYTIKKDWNEIDPAMQKLFGDDISKVPQGIWYVFDGDNTVYTEGKTTAYTTEYTGNKIEINNDVHVFYATHRLWENRDYSISYKNNIDAGMVTLIIKGKGNYSNSVTFKFNISKADMNNAEISSEKIVAVKSGTRIGAIKPVLSFDGKKLELNKDYVLTYANTGRPDSNVLPSSTVGPGEEYRITISAKDTGNFTGTKSETIKVKAVDSKDRSMVLIKNVKVTIPKQQWNSKGISAIELFDNSSSDNAVAKVTNGKHELKYDTDFSVDDVKFDQAGKHQLALHGQGKYAGDKIVTVEVTGISSGKVKVACMSTSVEYTGSSMSIDDLYMKDATGYASQGKTNKPVSESNYDIVMTNSGSVGKFDVMLKLKGEYSGTITKTVTVKPYDIEKDNRKKITISCNSVSYSKAGSIPEVIVRFGDEVLTEGTDYTLSYKNNAKAAEYNAQKAPTVVVKGIGNFKGKREAFYTINKAGVSNIKLSVPDKAYKAKASKGYFKSLPKIMDGEKTLSIGNGKDIEKISKNAYKYYYAETGEEIPDNAVVSLNTLIEVRVKIACSTSSSYIAGTYEISGYYRLIEKNKDISKAIVRIKNPENLSFAGGSEIIPLKSEDLSVELNKNNLDTSEYEIVSVKNNRFLGTAIIELRGKGQYGGIKIFKFKIRARNI